MTADTSAARAVDPTVHHSMPSGPVIMMPANTSTAVMARASDALRPSPVACRYS